MTHPDESRLEALRGLVQRLGLDWLPDGAQTIHQSLIHRSWAMEQQSAIDNERLEFLGDSVLSLVTSELLLERDPLLREGEASIRRAAIVSRQTLDVIGADLNLGSLLILGIGEEKAGGRRRASILGSALEAVVGALYLTYPWPAVRAAVRRHMVEPAIAHVDRQDLTDYKSALQIFCQKRAWPLPAYRLVEETGPENRKQFTIAVYVRAEEMGRSSAERKQVAERAAAKEAVGRLEAREEAAERAAEAPPP